MRNAFSIWAIPFASTANCLMHIIFNYMALLTCLQALSAVVALPHQCNQGRQSWGGLGSRPPDFGQKGRGVVVGGSQEGRGRVEEYYYTLSCTGSMFENDDLWRDWIIFPEVAVNGQFLPGKSEFFVKLLENIEIFWKFAWKNRNSFVKLPEKIDIFRKFAWQNQFF